MVNTDTKPLDGGMEVSVKDAGKILKKSGYDGYISVEFEGAEDKLYGIKEGLENVKRFWEMF